MLAELVGKARSYAGEARVGGGALAATLVACGALIVLRLASPPLLGDATPTPVTALDHVPAELRAQPVLNSYDLGGFLIFEGIKPFIDGRTDMYGDAFNARYDAIVRPDAGAFQAAARQYGIRWTFLQPSSPLAAMLDASPEWRRLYADRYAVIHVRR